MFCPQCGTGNPEGAAACAKCGAALLPAQVVLPPGSAPGQQVPNYLVQAILVTILCCLPLGIPAIVFAAQVNGKLAAGDVAGAMAASKNAKLFCWISFWIGLGASILGFIVGISGVLMGGRHY
jgi:hypothetical protein